jgi:hypothetical protein
MWELLIANHLDQSLWSTNQKYWAAARSNLLHSFLEVHNCVAHFTSHGGTLHEIWCRKTYFLCQAGTFWLFHNKFYYLESHTEHRWIIWIISIHIHPYNHEFNDFFKKIIEFLKVKNVFRNQLDFYKWLK